MKTQMQRIIDVLERDNQIDNFQAISNRLTLRLGARIWDLKKRGWEFETELRDDKNTIYRVLKQPAPEPISLFI